MSECLSWLEQLSKNKEKNLQMLTFPEPFIFNLFLSDLDIRLCWKLNDETDTIINLEKLDKRQFTF